MRRVSVFFFGTPANSATRRDAFVKAMLEAGYMEGRNIRFDWRYAIGQVDLVERNARELVGDVADAIVSFSTTNAQALKNAGVTAPVVMIAVDDPVRSGFAHDLSRPGMNFTGMTTNVIAQAARYVELLSEATARPPTIGLLASPGSTTYKLFRSRVEAEAMRRTIKVVPLDVTAPSEIDRVLGGGMPSVQGLIVTSDALFYNERRRIAELAVERRLPSIYPRFGYVEAGGLMSYGPSDEYMATRAASYVSRIFDGDSPADMAIEGPTRYEMGVSRKAAAAIGLALPASIVQKADRVIA